MSDIPSIWPDNSAILQQIKAPSWYEKVLGKEYQIQSNQIKGIILNVKDKNITIINNPEKYSQLQDTKQQTEALSEDFKQEFIEKLKKLPDFEWSKIQEVIKNWKLEIIKTKPISFKKQKLEILINESKYALYEKWWNLLYFVELNWDKYFHVDRVREWIAWWTIENRLESYFWWRQVLENWIYNIYIWDRKIDINSEEYRKILLICWESVIQLKKELEKLYEQKKGWF